MIRIRNQEDYLKYYQLAKEDSDGFWSQVASEFKWKKPWEVVQQGSFSQQDVKWFVGGKVNITENCLDRHLADKSEKVAIIYEPNNPSEESIKITYGELSQRVNQVANGFRSLGVKKGDRICFYMSMVPELLIGILACARIGAIHSVIFGGFSAKALSDRLNDCSAKILVTNDGGARGEKLIPLKEICDEALKTSNTVEKVIVHKRKNNKISWGDIDLDWNDFISGQSDSAEAEAMDSEDPLFILYTSGSTGSPKGLVHTCAGYMVYAQYSFENVFQMQKEEDVFWCSADIGWITGHTYMTYGPLLAGVTQVMFEGIPTYPDPGRFWQAIDKHKVTHFYTAPTAIRALEACDLSFVQSANLDSLKVLGSVGEPINEEAWQWYNDNVGNGKCPIVDTWWQTETGGIMVSPLAHITKMKPCFATNPLPGIELALMDPDNNEIDGNGVEGNLVVKRPWPSIARTVYGDPERYKTTYFSAYPGRYFTGDGAKRDIEGDYRIIGRVDDVINVSGHRIGTAEVEDALNQHLKVVESAVVGYPHDIKGQGIYAYIVCPHEVDDIDKLVKELQDFVSKEIGSFSKPEKIQIVQALPKTRSGKIMRRILRKVAANELDNFGDTSTLLNPEAVEDIVAGRIS
tara:strand:+ start:18376 stop:20271 length:1896 start_codon:yes stop_codon:yes gene_type:complete